MGIQGVLMDKSQITKALHDNKGVIEHTAKALKCDPTTIYDWIRRDEEVAQALKDARANRDLEHLDAIEELKPKVIESARDLVSDKNVPTTLFFLKSLFGLSEYQKPQSTAQEYIINYGNDPKQVLSSTVSASDTPNP